MIEILLFFHNLQNKAKLLEDLEKNTFPKNKIPTEWVQSLQQLKNEYEKLKAERFELEEQRNNLVIFKLIKNIIGLLNARNCKKFFPLLLQKTAEKTLPEKDIELEFSDKCSDTESKKQRPDLEMKSAAYKMFKEVLVQFLYTFKN